MGNADRINKLISEQQDPSKFKDQLESLRDDLREEDGQAKADMAEMKEEQIILKAKQMGLEEANRRLEDENSELRKAVGGSRHAIHQVQERILEALWHHGEILQDAFPVHIHFVQQLVDYHLNQLRISRFIGCKYEIGKRVPSWYLMQNGRRWHMQFRNHGASSAKNAADDAVPSGDADGDLG